MECTTYINLSKWIRFLRIVVVVFVVHSIGVNSLFIVYIIDIIICNIIIIIVVNVKIVQIIIVVVVVDNLSSSHASSARLLGFRHNRFDRIRIREHNALGSSARLSLRNALRTELALLLAQVGAALALFHGGELFHFFQCGRIVVVGAVRVHRNDVADAVSTKRAQHKRGIESWWCHSLTLGISHSNLARQRSCRTSRGTTEPQCADDSAD
jgi:hypothetical protein